MVWTGYAVRQVQKPTVPFIVEHSPFERVAWMAARSMRPARNIVSRSQLIRARASPTVKQPKCGRQRRW